jgi:CubicO group peptidase (beta-lactamase class C family)
MCPNLLVLSTPSIELERVPILLGMTVSGTCAPELEPLRDLLAANLADGTDLGASVAVVRDGELVADLWGGAARLGVPWTADTVVGVWSVSKTMAALTTLVLADRGEIDLDAPVSSYWKEFRRDDVLVRHLLSHTSGYAGWTEPLDVEGLLDLEHAERMLAEQQPWWEPGTESGYHMICYGHLLDGLVRAATGTPLADQFRTLVAEPLGADFHLGVPEAVLPRCADLVPPTEAGIDIASLPDGNLLLPTILNPVLDVERLCNTPAWRRVAVSGANGHGNARSIARVQSVVSHGGEVDGVRLLSEATIDRIFEVQADGPDRVLAVPLRWGIGYGLPQPLSAPAVPNGRVCWWTGWGGAIVVNDLDRRVTVAYAMNRMADHFTSSPRTDHYLRTAFDGVAALS